MSIIVFGKGNLGKNFISKCKNLKVLSKKECNITNAKHLLKVIEKYKPNIVINTAASTDMNFCEKNKKEAWLNNVYGANNVAKLCKKYSIYSIQISSDNAINPINEYGYTKKISEKLGFSSVIRVNFFSKNHWLIKKILMNQKVSLLTTNLFNPLFLDTTTDTILNIAKKNITGTYNLGTIESLSYYSFGKMLCKKLKRSDLLIAKIQKLESSFTYKYSSYMSTKLVKNKLGFVFNIEKEINKYVNSINK